MASVPVSKVTPDFQVLFDALRRKLKQKDSWEDILPTSVGTTVLDLFAGSHVTNQLYIDVALREAFLPTAVRDSSIFAGTRMLGVEIARKTCASTVLEISNYATRTKFIPPYTQFDLSGRPFFNREQYIVPPGSAISNVDVFSGTVKEKKFNLANFENLALREFYMQEPGFVVSSADILIYTEDKDTGNITVWDKTDKAIFEHHGEEAVYFESTARDGDTSFFFGDGQHGKLLDQNTTMNIRYAITTGSAGNNGLPGIKARVNSDSEIKGETITAIAGGANEKSALYYKLFASNMHRTKRRAISRADIRSTIMGYPGIADCAVLGQRDIAPDDLRWMNMVRLCILPEETDSFGGANPNPQSSTWRAFVDWMQPLMHDAYDIQTWNPNKVYVKIRVKIAILPSAKENEIRIVASENLLKLFEKKPGILGRRLSESDITNAIRKIEGVDYVIVVSPEEDILMQDRTNYTVLDGPPLIDIVYSERTLGVRGDY